MRRRAGFTLIEILVSLAVVIAVAALASPVVMGALDADARREAPRRVQLAATLARAEAAREQRPIVLRWSVDGDRIVVRGASLTAPDEDTEFGFVPEGVTAGEFGALDERDDELRESFRVVMPGRLGVPDDALYDSMGAAGDETAAAEFMDAPEVGGVLAIVLPDGLAMRREWLVIESGRWLIRLRVGERAGVESEQVALDEFGLAGGEAFAEETPPPPPTGDSDGDPDA